jgi:hypothetical protein
MFQICTESNMIDTIPEKCFACLACIGRTFCGRQNKIVEDKLKIFHIKEYFCTSPVSNKTMNRKHLSLAVYVYILIFDKFFLLCLVIL